MTLPPSPRPPRPRRVLPAYLTSLPAKPRLESRPHPDTPTLRGKGFLVTVREARQTTKAARMIVLKCARSMLWFEAFWILVFLSPILCLYPSLIVNPMLPEGYSKFYNVTELAKLNVQAS